MNNESRPPTEPFALTDPSPADSRTSATPDVGDRIAPAATFTGRTHRKSEAVRGGLILGTGLVVALGAAVVMGASPSPSPAVGQPQTVPGGVGQGGPGPRFEFGPGAGGPGVGGPGDLRGDFKGGPGRGFGAISVTAIDGTKVSLATADGWTRTIAVTSSTTITKGGAAATLADLAVGDTIHFRQTRNDDGTFTITAIEIIQPQVVGAVTAVGTDTITITLRDGTSQTVRTTGTTAYRVERADGARAAVTVGTTIVATGEKNADGSLTASSVLVRLQRVAGTVKTATADTITLTRRDGTTVTIHVGAGTTIRVAGVENATRADVKAGMMIVVDGTTRADGSVDATAIGAGDRGKGRFNDGKKGAKPDASVAPSPSAGTEG